MLPAAAVLSVALLLLALVVPDRLAGASWAPRSPVLALLLWQALGLAGGLLTLEVALTLALAPAGPTHLQAVQAIAVGSAPGLGIWSYLALAGGAVVLLRLLSVLLSSATRTLRARRDHRMLVDLVATRNPLLPGAHVVDHELPVAYCLPGLRPRVVLSRGVMELLRDDELRAVLAHEAAHVTQRHDVVVLPFVALRATFPGLRGVRTAQAEVALLVEMLADDRAARRYPRDVLARALYKVGAGAVPAGGLAIAGAEHGAVLVRAQRLLQPQVPLRLRSRMAVLATTAGVLSLVPLGLLLPLITLPG